MPTSKIPCSRCYGHKSAFERFKHVHSGLCLRCSGSGEEPEWAVRKAERISAENARLMAENRTPSPSRAESHQKSLLKIKTYLERMDENPLEASTWIYRVCMAMYDLADDSKLFTKALERLRVRLSPGFFEDVENELKVMFMAGGR